MTGYARCWADSDAVRRAGRTLPAGEQALRPANHAKDGFSRGFSVQAVACVYLVEDRLGQQLVEGFDFHLCGQLDWVEAVNNPRLQIPQPVWTNWCARSTTRRRSITANSRAERAGDAFERRLE